MGYARVASLFVGVLSAFSFVFLAWQNNIQSKRVDTLLAELGNAKRTAPLSWIGTSGEIAGRNEMVDQIKRELRDEMGLLSITLMRERRNSFVELNSYDNRGSSNYGTAGYLGHGYFITVKHGVVALGHKDVAEPRKIISIKLKYKGKALNADILDTGDADAEVQYGDWAILKIKEAVNLPPLELRPNYGFVFADPIFRLGNDYSRGIILATGYVGQRIANGLVTSLTDGHPGVSGGGILNSKGEFVGIPIGRMQGDFRFSFILPLREEMFRKVPHLLKAN